MGGDVGELDVVHDDEVVEEGDEGWDRLGGGFEEEVCGVGSGGAKMVASPWMRPWTLRMKL